MSAEARRRRLTAWSGGLVAVLAIAARVAHLDGFSLGRSEIAYLATASLPDAELAYRLISVAFGVLTVLVLWRWTRERWGAMPALAVGLLAALSPPQVRFSQEIGPFAMGTFFAVAAVFCLDRWLETRSRRRALLLGAALVGTALSWPLLLVVLGPTLALMAEGSLHVADGAVSARRQTHVWLAAILLAALTAAGALAARVEPAAGHESPASRSRWRDAPVAQRLEALTLGAKGSKALTPVSAITVALVLVGAGVAFRTTTGRAILGGALAGTAGIEAVLWFHPDPPASRHLLGSLFLLVLVGLGAHRLASAFPAVRNGGGLRRVASIAAATALMGAVLLAQADRLRDYYAHGRPHWDWIASVVSSLAAPGEEIVATDESTQLALNHYLAAIGAPLAAQIAFDDDSHDLHLASPAACAIVVDREDRPPRRSRRTPGGWLHLAAEGAGARVYVSGGTDRRDCLRTPRLELRKEISGPVRGLLSNGRELPEDVVLEFDAATRPHLAYGWSVLESAGGKTFAWVEGRYAAVDLDLRAGGDRLLIVDLWPLERRQRAQGVEIRVNGAPVASADLHANGDRLTVDVPANLLHDGENRIAFEFRYTTLPLSLGLSPDDRHLAAAFDRLEVRDR